MNETQLDRAFADLRRGSQVSLVLMLVGALFLLGSVYYAATRLKPLEREIAERKAQVEGLAAEEAEAKRRIAALQREYATLKTSTQSLYAVRVTPDNQVYELKATAQATGRTGSGRPQYRFAIYVNSPPRVLASIRSVEYRFDHPTFDRKQLLSTDAGSQFRVEYLGWGCLRRVGVTVTLKDTTAHEFDFDMCRSLGPQWGNSDAFPGKGGPQRKLAPVAGKPGALPDMAEPPRLPRTAPATSDNPDPSSNRVDKRPPPSNGY